MARAIWTGTLSFGLVSIPVGLYSATEDKAIRFHQFQEGTTDRIRNKRVNERTGEEVEYSDIVKWAPNRSRIGCVSSPGRVVAPTHTNP